MNTTELLNVQEIVRERIEPHGYIGLVHPQGKVFGCHCFINGGTGKRTFMDCPQFCGTGLQGQCKPFKKEDEI